MMPRRGAGDHTAGRDGARFADAPAACPYCGSHDVRTSGYDAPLRILHPRRWHYCTRCGWEAEAIPSAEIAASAAGRLGGGGRGGGGA